MNKKSTKTEIDRNDLKYVRIDNYRELELYRGIIIEAITRIDDSEEPFKTEKKSNFLKYVQKYTHSILDIRDIREGLLRDKEKIKGEIKKYSNIANSCSCGYLERLKDNDWAIRMVLRIFTLEENLIVRIFKRLSMADHTSISVKNHNNHNAPQKDFIDILNEEIDRQYYYDSNSKRKTINITSKNRRSTKLVKHYLLKYIQKPLLAYGIDYSNTLLNEYNFQKISLEMDMSIPEEEQQDLIKKTLKKLYSEKLQYTYSEVMAQTLLADIKDIKLNKVRKGRKRGEEPLSIRVADLFYIYDLRARDISYEECAKLLSNFHSRKKNSFAVDKGTVYNLSGTISNFMKDFQKIYKIQPSNLFMSFTDSEKNR